LQIFETGADGRSSSGARRALPAGRQSYCQNVGEEQLADELQETDAEQDVLLRDLSVFQWRLRYSSAQRTSVVRPANLRKRSPKPHTFRL